ncbi:MAG: nickel pincer cofactor biosynthesis protein LarC [Flavobacteriaceae bacterium]|nr:nickel pincer cofactor biosynthesis protein LarC [Flavobacteriaceae bacterium]
MRTILIEAFSGLSGDMFLGALASLADAYDDLKRFPEMFDLPDAKIEISEVNKNGIVCKHVHVIDLNEEKDHHHRHLSDILQIIENANITEKTKQIAKDIFTIIGRSESKIHNIPLEKIHFHEVSGVDSIIDVLGCAVLIDRLKITKTYATPVCTGFGFVNTQHGILPVPAPATADILLGIPNYTGEEKGEKVTPTGAAILKYLDPDFDVPVLKKKQIAYGPGMKDFKSPNVLRLSLCEESKQLKGTYVLETNIDDMSNEFLGNDFQNGLFKNGANDFFTSAIQMKKGRQGVLLSCSVAAKNIEKLSDYIFENTSTIGIRSHPVKVNRLEREIKEFLTSYGKINVKTVTTPSGRKKVKIEYDDLKKIHLETKIPLHVLQFEILKEINNNQ